jgi:hypothetical protein
MMAWLRTPGIGLGAFSVRTACLGFDMVLVLGCGAAFSRCEAVGWVGGLEVEGLKRGQEERKVEDDVLSRLLYGAYGVAIRCGGSTGVRAGVEP